MLTALRFGAMTTYTYTYAPTETMHDNSPIMPGNYPPTGHSSVMTHGPPPPVIQTYGGVPVNQVAADPWSYEELDDEPLP